jgi:AcrR family transcriptional regulator
MNNRIRQPRQDRSQASMERILDAFEMLLRKSDYDSITINEIANESVTGAGSIYARFDGKQSILLALHARARERARKYFEQLFNPAVRAGEDLDAAIERITRGMMNWHKRQRHIIKTSLLLNDADIYQGVSASFRPWSEHLAALLQSRGAVLTQAGALAAAIAILQVTTAALQQWVIFGKVAPVGHRLTDAELVAVIKAAALGQVQAQSTATC